MEIRSPDPAEVDSLARIWYDAWRDSHLELLPAELIRHRTLESFRERMAAGLAHVRVAGPPGAAVGFHMLRGDELYQLFVAAPARGGGAAAALVADAEQRLREDGVETAWLACAIGNDRAARFYEKTGWRRVGTFVSNLETPDGTLPLETWRYEKELGGPPAHA